MSPHGPHALVLDVILVIPSLVSMTNILARRDLWLSWMARAR